jgi:hypothetical protein
METFGSLKRWHVDRYLAVGRRQKPKKRTQDNGGSRKKLATACRGMMHHAIPAWCKRQGCIKNPERTDVWEETSGETGRHQWNKDPWFKEVTMSWKREDIRQDLRENHRA